MAHTLVYDSETTTDIVFKCTKCSKVIGFNKPGIGEPSAFQDVDGSWDHPTNPEQWMGECDASNI